MDDKIKKFLDSVCGHIKYKPIHEDIKSELTVHINELKDAFMNETQDEQSSIDLAISAMGNCGEIGSQLNKQHKPKTEWSLIGLTAVIALIGSAILYVTSNISPFQPINFERHLMFSAVGLTVLFGVYFFDYTKIRRFSLPIFVVSLAMLLILGSHVVGGRMMIILHFPISIEIFVPIFLISFAGFIHKAEGKGGLAALKLFVPGFISVLLLLQFSLSHAFALSVGYVILITAAIFKNHFGGNKKAQIITLLTALTGSLGLIFFSVIFFSAFRMTRLSSFLNRGLSDPLGTGFTRVVADQWLLNSNLFGPATETLDGRSFQSMLPNIAHDYVVVNIIGTFGWAAGILFILTVITLICRMIITVSKIKNGYGFYVSLAACTILAVQFIVGILVNFGLLPATSIYVPFVSFGLTGYVVGMALVGLVLSVWRRDDIIPAEQVIDDKGRFVEVCDGKVIIDFRRVRF